MKTTVPHFMTVDAFLAWEPEGNGPRYELVAGEPVAMAPERVIHTRVKTAAVITLDRAIAEAGLDCEVLTDGATGGALPPPHRG